MLSVLILQPHQGRCKGIVRIDLLFFPGRARLGGFTTRVPWLALAFGFALAARPIALWFATIAATLATIAAWLAIRAVAAPCEGVKDFRFGSGQGGIGCCARVDL